MDGGLRERKRRAAIRRIQQVALDLFDARGFQNVSIEEIASAAEVSPSTVYRYFGTKERIVLYDEVDVRFVERVEQEVADHPPVTAVRRTLTAVLTQYFDSADELTRRKLRYVFEDPALRAATLMETEAFVPVIAELLGRATGRDAAELDVQVIAATIVAALLAAVRHWYSAGADTPLANEIDRALTVVEGGLRLEPRPAPSSPSRSRGQRRAR